MQKVKIARKFKESVHLLYFRIVFTSMCKPNTLESGQLAMEERIQNIQYRAYQVLLFSK